VGIESNWSDESGKREFSVENPHHMEWKFRLKNEETDQAILCWDGYGPIFGFGPADLFVADECNSNSDSYTRGFGTTYLKIREWREGCFSRERTISRWTKLR
jgi:hypothetical protein